MHLNHKAADAEIARWKRLAEERRIRDRDFAEETSRLVVGYNVTMNAIPMATEAPPVSDENGNVAA